MIPTIPTIPSGSAPLLILGTCPRALELIPDNSVDSIVTDPPYGLSKQPDMAEVLRHWLAGDDYTHTGGGFMGKSWDSFVPGPSIWRECLRVLKPGGHLLASAGTRTMDLMGLSLRLAGFELRDSIGYAHDDESDGAPLLAWAYGQGFPKSLNVQKATGDDRHAGLGTALKPAWEPILIARKPLIGTVAENVQQFGTGAINVDGCRIGQGEPVPGGGNNYDAWRSGEGRDDRPQSHGKQSEGHNLGRWPANLVHDGSASVIESFPANAGAFAPVTGTEPSSATKSVFGQISRKRANAFHADNGSAARFFYCAKASKRDRDEGCEALPVTVAADMVERDHGSAGMKSPRAGAGRTSGARNFHPTVKPTELMRWLVRLVTPAGGVVLDPFMGSGSTGKAAAIEGMRFIGCEMDPSYMQVAAARIGAAAGERVRIRIIERNESTKFDQEAA